MRLRGRGVRRGRGRGPVDVLLRRVSRRVPALVPGHRAVALQFCKATRDGVRFGASSFLAMGMFDFDAENFRARSYWCVGRVNRTRPRPHALQTSVIFVLRRCLSEIG